MTRTKQNGGGRGSSSVNTAEAIVTCDVCDTALLSEGSTVLGRSVQSCLLRSVLLVRFTYYLLFIAYLYSHTGINELVRIAQREPFQHMFYSHSGKSSAPALENSTRVLNESTEGLFGRW